MPHLTERRASRVLAHLAPTILAAVMISAAPVHAEEPAPQPPPSHLTTALPDMGGVRWVDDTWSLGVDLGFGARMAGERPFAMFGRVAAGWLRIREPITFTLAALVDLSTPEPWSFGARAEIGSLVFGFWAQGGVLVDTRGQSGLLMAGGWSLFGFEAQVRWNRDGDATWALFGKLNIPIRWFFFIGEKRG